MKEIRKMYFDLNDKSLILDYFKNKGLTITGVAFDNGISRYKLKRCLDGLIPFKYFECLFNKYGIFINQKSRKVYFW